MHALPVRVGPRPLTTDCIPHSQVDQQPADASHLAAVLQQAGSWSGVVETGSGISVPGARALLLADGLPTGPAEAFLVGREFCHGHAQGDHSLHLALPPALAVEAEQAGWVEPHFLAKTGGLPRTVVMLYAPRDADEVTVALDLVRASFAFARGATAPTPRQERLHMDAHETTDHTTMNTIVHAAFRRDLARFDAALACFPDGSQQRADELGRAWDFYEEELHHHHSYEEQYFWPALRQTDADLSAVEHLDEEHEDMRRALQQATAVMAELRRKPGAEHAAAARAAVMHLGDVLRAHLAHEEADLEPISAAYQDSPPMKAALAQVKKAHLRNMGNFVEWLQDGATAKDKAALRREMPAPVIALFGAVAGRRYRRQVAPVWSSGTR